ncbi:MAG: hypothetical protein CMJ25_24500 [Phycisphaerae bacterium]|jgi:hypothetical protein|nr:hypothetical protein [Phycisphaerae bacterium]|tara:strand:- start:170 stop:403 length:234 start_codon:yes stop_codon:yes gene_type:complete
MNTATETLMLCENHGFDDLWARTAGICDSVILHGASPGTAHAELQDIWEIAQGRVADKMIPPDEEQLVLLNPTFLVD